MGASGGRVGAPGLVGSRGHGSVRRLLLGSTSTRLVRDARRPVLVVPRPVACSAEDEQARGRAAAP
jgi:hypothetical protein